MAFAALDDINGLLRDVATDENLRVTVQESVKGGLITVGAGAVGGMLLGPAGFPVGGAVGGLAAAATCSSFKPVAQVIYEMPRHQQERLAEKVRNIMTWNNIQNVAALAVAAGAAGAVRNEIIQVIQRFMKNEMQMALA